jgi:hypothetical protein
MCRKPVLLCLLWALIFVPACARNSKVTLITSPVNDFTDCVALFPECPWEAVHGIEAKLGVGGSFSLIGLTKGDPVQGNSHSALLTPEGFVLFQAERREGRLSVIRALPPFDSHEFAKGLIEDVELIFLAPRGRPSESGMASDGSFVCRWIEPFGQIKEIIRAQSDRWKISLWNDQGRLIRQVWVRKQPTENLASQVELRATGVNGYRLKMLLFQSSQ